MSKQTAVAASVDLNKVRNFSFLTLLTIGLYLLFCGAAFASGACENGVYVDCTVTVIQNDTPNPGDTTTCVTTYDASGNSPGPVCNVVTAGGGGSTTLSGVAEVICDVVYMLTLDIGRGVATLAVIALGVAAMFGKATWTQAVTVGVGIGIIFGSLTMGTLLTANVLNISGTSLGCLDVFISGVR